MQPIILVLGISGNVSQGILRVLRKNFPNAFIIGSCVNETYYRIFSDTFIKSPFALDENFLEWLVETCNVYNVDIIFSGVEEINLKIAENISFLKDNTNAKTTCSPLEVQKIGINKFVTSEWFNHHGIDYPETILLNNKEDIFTFWNRIRKPIILKPVSGKGSNGIVLIKEIEDIEKFGKEPSNYIAQELIGTDENEYTVGCYQLQDSRIVNPIIMKRKLYQGNTVYAELIDNASIAEYCIGITNKLNPMGPLNVQLRLREDNSPTCFEINVRYSGTTVIRDHFGFKDVVAMVNEKCFLGNIDNLFNPQSKGICIRIVDEIFSESSNLNRSQISRYE